MNDPDNPAPAKDAASAAPMHAHDAPPSLPPGMTGADVLDAIRDAVTRFVALPSDAAADALALFVAVTYCADACEVAPYLYLASAEKRSGKTTTMRVLERLTCRPLAMVLPSPAILYRTLCDGGHTSTLLLDEVDALFTARGSEAGEIVRGVLNAGNVRGGTVPRWNAVTNAVDRFDVFGPKVVAGILGNLPETLLDRCVPIILLRATDEEQADLTPGRRRNFDAAAAEVVPLVQAWADEVAEAVGEAEPVDLPASLSDRACDTWEPMVAIADAAGGDWPARARAAADALSAEEYDPDEGSVYRRLMMDCHAAFGDDVRVTAADLVARLRAMPDAPWHNLGARGDGLDAAALSRMVKPYGPRPKRMRKCAGHGGLAYGYDRAAFVSAWVRNCGIAVDAAMGLCIASDVEARTTDMAALDVRVAAIAVQGIEQVRAAFGGVDAVLRLTDAMDDRDAEVAAYDRVREVAREVAHEVAAGDDDD